MGCIYWGYREWGWSAKEMEDAGMNRQKLELFGNELLLAFFFLHGCMVILTWKRLIWSFYISSKFPLKPFNPKLTPRFPKYKSNAY